MNTLDLMTTLPEMYDVVSTIAWKASAHSKKLSLAAVGRLLVDMCPALQAVVESETGHARPVS